MEPLFALLIVTLGLRAVGWLGARHIDDWSGPPDC